MPQPRLVPLMQNFAKAVVIVDKFAQNKASPNEGMNEA